MTFLRSNDGLVCAAWAAAACLLAMVAAPACAQAAGPVVQQPDTVFLEELTWTELRAGIQAGKTTIIVPIGGTEQNGPHMALGKHNARVRTLAERVARTLGDAFVAPVIAYVAGGWLGDRFGRRGPGVGLTAGYVAFAAVGFVTGPFGFIAGNLLWSGFASAATPVMGAWAGELYPTRARATAEATGGVAGAIGGIAGLQAVGWLSRSVGLGEAIALVGIAALLGAAVLVLLPETKGQPLPD